MKTTLQPAGSLVPLMGIEDLSDYLGVPVATIYDWRVDGKGPVRRSCRKSCDVHPSRRAGLDRRQTRGPVWPATREAVI